MNIKSRQRRRGIKFLALAVVIIFTATSVTWNIPASAASVEVVASSLASVDHLVIPAEIGSITAQYHLGSLSSGDKSEAQSPRSDLRTVILIQDAHAVIDAQENIRKILGYLGKEYGVRLAALEGAKGRIEPVLFRAFPGLAAKQKVLAGYEDRAELSGAEMASVFQKEAVDFRGMEDWALYKQNYFAYLRAQEKKSTLLAKWNEAKQALDADRVKSYDPKLNEFEESRENFLSERTSLIDLLVYLSEFKGLLEPHVPESQKNVEGASGYRELPALIASIGYEKSGKQEALAPLVRKIADEFKVKYVRGLGVKNEMNFYNRYQAFMTGQITAGQMLQYLVKLGSEHGKNVKLTPALKKLLGHAELLSEIKGSRIYDELQRFLSEVEASLIKTSAAREVAEKYRKLFLLKEMITLELTHEDLARYQKEPDAYFDLFADSAFRQDLAPALDFYQAALLRDRSFMTKIDAMMKDSKQEQLVVVAGGFHTNGLERILKEQGIAYAVVTPRIDSLAGQANYAKVMRGDVSFKPDIKTTYFDALMRHASKALVEALPIPDRVGTLKLWRDNVIRDLAGSGRITDAGKYLPYIDELLRNYGEVATVGAQSTKEQVIDSVRKELEKFKTDSFGKIWETFESQLDLFTNGLRQLVAKKTLSRQTVAALLDRTAQAKPSMIPSPLYMDPGIEVLALGQGEERPEARILQTDLSQIMRGDQKELLGAILKNNAFLDKSIEAILPNGKGQTITSVVGKSHFAGSGKEILEAIFTFEDGSRGSIFFIARREALREEAEKKAALYQEVCAADPEHRFTYRFGTATVLEGYQNYHVVSIGNAGTPLNGISRSLENLAWNVLDMGEGELRGKMEELKAMGLLSLRGGPQIDNIESDIADRMTLQNELVGLYKYLDARAIAFYFEFFKATKFSQDDPRRDNIGLRVVKGDLVLTLMDYDSMLKGRSNRGAVEAFNSIVAKSEEERLMAVPNRPWSTSTKDFFRIIKMVYGTKSDEFFDRIVNDAETPDYLIALINEFRAPAISRKTSGLGDPSDVYVEDFISRGVPAATVLEEKTPDGNHRSESRVVGSARPIVSLTLPEIEVGKLYLHENRGLVRVTEVNVEADSLKLQSLGVTDSNGMYSGRANSYGQTFRNGTVYSKVTPETTLVNFSKSSKWIVAWDSAATSQAIEERIRQLWWVTDLAEYGRIVSLHFGFSLFRKRFERHDKRGDLYRKIFDEVLPNRQENENFGELKYFLGYGENFRNVIDKKPVVLHQPAISDHGKLIAELLLRVFNETGEDLIKTAASDQDLVETGASWPSPGVALSKGLRLPVDYIPTDFNRYWRQRLLTSGLKDVLDDGQRERYERTEAGSIHYGRNYYPTSDAMHEQDEFSKLIVALKADPGNEIIAKRINELCSTSIEELKATGHGDIVVPIPSMNEKNHAATLAKVLAENLGKPVSQGLEQVRDKQSQKSLNAAERLLNVSGVFEGDPDALKGKTVLIVDDVTTTGATLQEAMRAAYLAGAYKVLIYAFGHTTRSEAPDRAESRMGKTGGTRVVKIAHDWVSQDIHPPEGLSKVMDVPPVNDSQKVDLNKLEPGALVFLNGQGGYSYLIQVMASGELLLWFFDTDPKQDHEAWCFRSSISNLQSLLLGELSWFQRIKQSMGSVQVNPESLPGEISAKYFLTVPSFSNETKSGKEPPMQEGRMFHPSKIRVLRAENRSIAQKDVSLFSEAALAPASAAAAENNRAEMRTETQHVTPVADTRAGFSLIHRGTVEDPLRIVLIMPRSPFQKEKPTRLPLGVMSLASCLRDKSFMEKVALNSGEMPATKIPSVQVTILDLQAEEDDFDLAARLKEIDPDMVGVSAVTPFIQEAVKIAATAQAVVPKAVRVLGGAHVSALEKDDQTGLKQLLDESSFHMAVLGQGEQVFPEAVLRLFHGMTFDTLAGVAYKQDLKQNEPVTVHRRSSPKAERIGFEDYPLPSASLDLVNQSGYARMINIEGKDVGIAGVIMTSLSCPFNCTFCASKAIFDSLFVFSSNRVIADIKNQYDHGIRAFYIADDNFLLNKKRSKELAARIRKEFPDIHYSMMTRADSVDEEVAADLKLSGCQVASIGVETGDPVLLQKINKRMSLETLERATQILQKNGIHVKYFLMVGLPGQDWASVLKTAQILVRLKPDSANVAVATPYPGSQLFRSGEIHVKAGYGYEYFLHEPEPDRKASDQVDVITWTDAMSSEGIAEAREMLMALSLGVGQGNVDTVTNIMSRIESLAAGETVATASRVEMRAVKNERQLPQGEELERILARIREKVLDTDWKYLGNHIRKPIGVFEYNRLLIEDIGILAKIAVTELRKGDLAKALENVFNLLGKISLVSLQFSVPNVNPVPDLRGMTEGLRLKKGISILWTTSISVPLLLTAVSWNIPGLERLAFVVGSSLIVYAVLFSFVCLDKLQMKRFGSISGGHESMHVTQQGVLWKTQIELSKEGFEFTDKDFLDHINLDTETMRSIGRHMPSLPVYMAVEAETVDAVLEFVRRKVLAANQRPEAGKAGEGMTTDGSSVSVPFRGEARAKKTEVVQNAGSVGGDMSLVDESAALNRIAKAHQGTVENEGVAQEAVGYRYLLDQWIAAGQKSERLEGKNRQLFDEMKAFTAKYDGVVLPKLAPAPAGSEDGAVMTDPFMFKEFSRLAGKAGLKPGIAGARKKSRAEMRKTPRQGGREGSRGSGPEYRSGQG